MKNIEILGAAVGHCAGKLGCEYAPEEIYRHFEQAAPELREYWSRILPFCGNLQGLNALPSLAQFSKELAQAVRRVLQQNKHFMVFGGDHSCAIGTWSGVASCHPDFGLIWLDAHLDAHTPETSPSGNLHGMPVAVLLGQESQEGQMALGEHGGNRKHGELSQFSPQIKPENLVLLGVRSYEPEELALLQRLGVRIYMMEEVRKRTLAQCFGECLAAFRRRRLPYGISLDLDILDTRQLSGLGTPEVAGIRFEEICHALSQVRGQDLLGMEIAEYNPKLSRNPAGDLAVIQQIVDSLLSRL